MTSKIKEKKCFIGVRLNPETYRWLQAKSDAEDLPMAAIVRREIARMMKNEK